MSDRPEAVANLAGGRADRAVLDPARGGRAPVEPGSPAAEVHRPGVDHHVVANDVEPLVVGDGGVDVGG